MPLVLLWRCPAIRGRFPSNSVTPLLHGWHCTKENGLTANRRKSLYGKECGKQDLNLHDLAATGPQPGASANSAIPAEAVIPAAIPGHRTKSGAGQSAANTYISLLPRSSASREGMHGCHQSSAQWSRGCRCEVQFAGHKVGPPRTHPCTGAGACGSRRRRRQACFRTRKAGNPFPRPPWKHRLHRKFDATSPVSGQVLPAIVFPQVSNLHERTGNRHPCDHCRRSNYHNAGPAPLPGPFRRFRQNAPVLPPHKPANALKAQISTWSCTPTKTTSVCSFANVANSGGIRIRPCRSTGRAGPGHRRAG